MPQAHKPSPVDSDVEVSEDEGLEAAIAIRGDEFDELGFVLPPQGDALGERARSYAHWFEPKATRRTRRFEARRQKLALPGEWATVPQTTLKALLRKGVPAEHRREVWWSVLGCEARRASCPLAYTQYVSKALVHRTAEEIERDLPRTFPNHRQFRASAGRAELRNVLHAYANHAPQIQYCQGLNFIAAILLIVFLDEERAFWALVCAIDRLGVEGYYSEGMTLLRADMRVLGMVLAKKCPKVARLFTEQNVELLSICSEWYITWFAKCLPGATILRVWDTLFFEGFKVLFRVAVGVFKRAEPEVMQCATFDALMERAKGWPRCMVEHNELLKASFAGIPALRRRDLVKAREEEVCRIEWEDEEHRTRIRENAARERARREAIKREATERAAELGRAEREAAEREAAERAAPAALQASARFASL